jgi:hypothetical protein
MAVGEETIENWMGYHPAVGAQPGIYETNRAEAIRLAKTWDARLPDGTEKDQALGKLREALMWANAGIACSGTGGYEPREMWATPSIGCSGGEQPREA